MSAMRAVLHKPKKETDLLRLLHEISQFRAEKTMQCLQEAGLQPQEVAEIANNLHSPF